MFVECVRPKKILKYFPLSEYLQDQVKRGRERGPKGSEMTIEIAHPNVLFVTAVAFTGDIPFLSPVTVSI